ncbi:hypothetical protein B0H14DRAFT_3437866 [Mycena olivaceomarginata]|nr:hypothetical protein B0H14DRAFT_3437866 [Mycena olivaceomarginata]
MSRFGRRRIPRGALRDLRWWDRFLPNWNGVQSIHAHTPGVTIFTDVSGSSSKGIGGHLGSRENPDDFFASRIPRRHRKKSNLFKELWAVLTWAGTCVTLRVDNTGAVDGLNGGSLREAPSQSLLREIFLITLSLNFSILCIWIDSKSNYVADALSRFDMHRLRNFLPVFFNAQHTAFPRLPTAGLLGLTSQTLSPSISGTDLRAPLEESTILPVNRLSASLCANMGMLSFPPTLLV